MVSHIYVEEKCDVLLEERRQVRESGGWVPVFICMYDTKQKCASVGNGSTMHKSILKTAKASRDKLAKELISPLSLSICLLIVCIALSYIDSCACFSLPLDWKVSARQGLYPIRPRVPNT